MSGEVILYQTEDGQTRVQCRFDEGTIWMTQVQIAELFQTSVPNINIHLKTIYAEGELIDTATIKSYLTVRAEGSRTVSREVLHYNLEAILAVANMGLTTWKGDVVRKGDVTVAKNYLHEDEITELNRIVVMFLDFAEDQARRRRQIFLRDWQTRLDDFLRFNERAVLHDAGRVTREQADHLAHEQYASFEDRRHADAERAGEAEIMKQLERAAEDAEKVKTSAQPRPKQGTRRGRIKQ